MWHNVNLDPQKPTEMCVIFIRIDDDDEKLKGNVKDIGRKRFLLEYTPKPRKD